MLQQIGLALESIVALLQVVVILLQLLVAAHPLLPFSTQPLVLLLEVEDMTSLGLAVPHCPINEFSSCDLS